MFFMDFRAEVSNIDNLLANEDVTLTEILDESDIIQECKTQNKSLIDFLVKPDNLTSLINFIVTTPAKDVDEKLQYKYPHVAYEVLSCDVCDIVDPIVQDEALLDRLWSFVEQKPPLNPLLASFFGKVLTVLFGQKSQEVFEYLKNHNAVDTLLRHIETSAIMQLFLKIASIVESRENRQMVSEWLTKERFIEKLVEGLHPSQSPEKHYNISQLICELVQLSRSTTQACLDNDPLTLCIERQETISLLLDNMFAEDGENAESSLVEGISILLSLVEPRKPSQFDGPDDPLTPPAAERIAQGVNTVLKALTPRLTDFNRVLLDPPKMDVMHTSAGSLEPPLGKVRLHIAWLLKAAVVTDTPFIISEIIQLSSLNVLLDLFFKYEWNNFLHTHIVHCLSAVVMSEPHPENDNPMLRHLIKDCNLITRVLDAWEENSERRKGYMGHLTNLFNELVSCKDSGASSEIFNSLFSELPEDEQERWSQTVAGSLDSLNKINSAPMQPINDSKLHSSSEDEEEYRPESSMHLSLSLHQEFANYQMHQMTDEFVESFGYNEEDLQNNDTDDNPFDDVGNIDFNINAKEETSNAAMFEAVCNQKIHQCNDTESDDEEMWEEKELSYSSTDGSKHSKPGSDGEGDDSAFQNNNDSYRDSHGSSDSSSSEDDQEQNKSNESKDIDMKENDMFTTSNGDAKTSSNAPSSASANDLDWNAFDTDGVAAMDILDSAAVGWGDSSAAAVKADDVPSFANFADMSNFTSSSAEDDMFSSSPFRAEEKEKIEPTLPNDVKMTDESPNEPQTDIAENQRVPASVPLSTETQSTENKEEDRERSNSVELASSEVGAPLVVTSKVMSGFVVIDTEVTTSSPPQMIASSNQTLKSSHISYQVKPNYAKEKSPPISSTKTDARDTTIIKENGLRENHIDQPLVETNTDVTPES